MLERAHILRTGEGERVSKMLTLALKRMKKYALKSLSYYTIFAQSLNIGVSLVPCKTCCKLQTCICLGNGCYCTDCASVSTALMLKKLKWILKIASTKEITIQMIITFNYLRNYYIRDYYIIPYKDQSSCCSLVSVLFLFFENKLCCSFFNFLN